MSSAIFVRPPGAASLWFSRVRSLTFLRNLRPKLTFSECRTTPTELSLLHAADGDPSASLSRPVAANPSPCSIRCLNSPGGKPDGSANTARLARSAGRRRMGACRSRFWLESPPFFLGRTGQEAWLDCVRTLLIQSDSAVMPSAFGTMAFTPHLLWSVSSNR